MYKSVKDILATVRDFTQSEQLEEILEIAEDVADLVPIPGIKLVIKLLRFLVKAKPLVNKGTDFALQVSEKSEASKKSDFQKLFDIAMMDGILTEEEQAFLKPKALAAGYSEDEFVLMVMNKTTF